MTNEEIRKTLNEFKDEAIEYMLSRGYRNVDNFDNNKWFDYTHFYKETYFKIELLIMFHDDDQVVSLRCGDGDLTLHPYAEYCFKLRKHCIIDAGYLKSCLYKMLYEFINTFGNIKNGTTITKEF